MSSPVDTKLAELEVKLDTLIEMMTCKQCQAEASLDQLQLEADDRPLTMLEKFNKWLAEMSFTAWTITVFSLWIIVQLIYILLLDS